MATYPIENRVRQTAHQMTDSSRQYVGEHPMSTTMAAFGLGLGVGVALVYLMTDHPHERRHAGLTQRVGRQVLDAMSAAIPESLAKYGR